MRGRFVYGVVTLLVLAALYACWCGAPLIWDGAYQLNWTLIRQEPYVYRTRFHTLILWQPLALISRYTSSRTVIYLAYGLPFLLAPAVGLLVSWWVLRRQSPWLILWVIFGVAIGPLPGQIFVINDSIFQQHLFWPLFAALFARVNWQQWVVLAALAVFQFAHPIGSMLFFGIAAAAVALAFFDKDHRHSLWIKAGVALLLGAASLCKVIQYPDPYAAEEATWLAAKKCWEGGVQGYPIHGLAFMWAAGVLFFAGMHLRPADQATTLAASDPAAPVRASTGLNVAERLAMRERFAQLSVTLAFVCAISGGAIWIYWAAGTHRWPWASEYRRWVVPLTTPFYALCWLDYLLRMRQRRTFSQGNARLEGVDGGASAKGVHWPRLYRAFGGLLACVFVAVLSIQSTIFARLTHRLLQDMRRWPGAIVPDEVVAWRSFTPLQHWSVTDLAIAVQGKQPRQLLASPQWVRMLYGVDGQPPVFPNYTVYPHPPSPNTNGWYDMRPIVDHLPTMPPF
jgi:hypothetical protein